MSEVWRRWEGQVADRKYHLRQYLGSTDHSAVFLAEFRDPELRQAAVKFISADLVNAEKQLAAWKNATQLSHPNLLRIYSTGRCKMEEMELLYVAMEHAEENLAQVLPQRALTADETRDMLNALAEVLVYLHEKKFAHGHIKPSNIHAIGEVLKLSSDTILPGGEIREMRRERSVYDAPELPASPYTPAADMWSLGVTLVEALAQQPADLPFDKQADPVVPPAVREPFLEIARHTLRRDLKKRWTSTQVAERLNPAAAETKSAAAAAGASASVPEASASSAAPVPPVTPPVSPLHVPLSKEPAIPLTKLGSSPAARPALPRAPVPPAPVRPVPREPRQSIVLPNYVLPLLAGVVILIAIIVLPKILRNREASASKPVASAVPPATTSAPAERVSSPAGHAEQPAKQPAQTTALPPAAKQLAAPEPAVLRSTETAPAPTPRNSSSSSASGQVLDQILPKAGTAAMASIQGTVRVVVKVHVDAAGNVSEAALENPGPSRYFADLSLKTSHGWVFTPPEIDGRSVPSEWLLQYYFTQSGVRAAAKQTQP